MVALSPDREQFDERRLGRWREKPKLTSSPASIYSIETIWSVSG